MSIKNYPIIRRQEKQKDYSGFWVAASQSHSRQILSAKTDKISERPYLVR